jgi:hypothetical protein
MVDSSAVIIAIVCPSGSGIGTSVMTNGSATPGSIDDDAILPEFFSDFVGEVAGDTISSTSGTPGADDL